MDDDFISRLLKKFDENILPRRHKITKCRHRRCNVILSIYNTGRYCYLHKEQHISYIMLTKKILSFAHRRHIARSIRKWWKKELTK